MRLSRLAIGLLICSPLFLAAVAPYGRAASPPLVQGVFLLPCPEGRASWNLTLAAPREYDLEVGLFSPGTAHFLVTVTGPAGTTYAVIDADFAQGAAGATYLTSFVAAAPGQYALNLTTSGGAGEAISVFLEVADAGLPHNSHAKADGSSKSFVAAEALTVSHYSFVASVPLEGNATYFLDVARATPCAADYPLTIQATAQLAGHPSIVALAPSALPWDEPSAAGQPLRWNGSWFAVPLNGTYWLAVTVSGVVAGRPCVAAISVTKASNVGPQDPSNGTSPPPGNSTAATTIGPEALSVACGVSGGVVAAIGVTTTASRRKKGRTSEAGKMKREVPAFQGDGTWRENEK